MLKGVVVLKPEVTAELPKLDEVALELETVCGPELAVPDNLGLELDSEFREAMPELGCVL